MSIISALRARNERESNPYREIFELYNESVGNDKDVYKDNRHHKEEILCYQVEISRLSAHLQRLQERLKLMEDSQKFYQHNQRGKEKGVVKLEANEADDDEEEEQQQQQMEEKEVEEEDKDEDVSSVSGEITTLPVDWRLLEEERRNIDEKDIETIVDQDVYVFISRPKSQYKNWYN